MDKLEKLTEELTQQKTYESVTHMIHTDSEHVVARQDNTYDLYFQVDNHGDDGEHELSEAQAQYDHFKQTYPKTRGFVYNGTSIRGLNG